MSDPRNDADRFTPPSFAWFEGIESNNGKEWFDAHRADYDRFVRGPLEALLLQAQVRIGGNLKLFRQHRDTRFSADKSPYRTEAIGTLHGRPGSDAGLYAEASSRGLWLASGNHMWARDQLERYLDAAADDQSGPELAAIVDDLERQGWEIQGEVLKGVPKVFAKDHPRGRLLKHKFLVAGRCMPPAETCAIADTDGLLGDFWQRVVPLNAWLDRHVGLSALPCDTRR